MRFWGIDLQADLDTPRLTWRRLSVLLAHLPPDSATLREIHGEMADWTTTDYLLAAILDVNRGANWQRGGGKGSRPQPIPRPKSAAQEKERQKRRAAHTRRVEERRAQWAARRAERGN